MAHKILSTGIPHKNLPDNYIRPESQRPNLSQVSECEDVPVIDLGSEDLSRILEQVSYACKHYGFFQVINHGVSKELAEEMQKVAKEFFNLPIEEKLKLYSDDPTKTMRLLTSFNVNKEEVHNWRDYLRLHCWPLEQYAPEWPSNPPLFKERVSKYIKEVQELGFRIQELISESLGLEKDYIKNFLGDQGQHMALNYYPDCPEPELTYGLPGHTDPNALTILLQDLQVSGLPIFKDGKWVAVKPQPDAFVINIGDQLQALSNGIYKSVWHRAVVNTDKPRLSVASFLCPSNNKKQRTRSCVTNGLRKKLKELMMEFQALRQRMMSKYKETVGSCDYTVTGKYPEDNVIEKIISGRTEEGENLSHAIQEHGRGKVVETVKEIQGRDDAAKEIERSLLKLHQVLLDMVVMVESQGEQLDDIERHVMNASNYVQDGTKNLKQAKDYQRGSRKCMCIGIIALLTVIPIIASFSHS